MILLVVLIGMAAAVLFTMGLDRLSQRLGYGARGTWLAVLAMISAGAVILFVSLPHT